MEPFNYFGGKYNVLKNHLAYSSFYVTIKQKGWSKDPGPPSGGDIPRHFFYGDNKYEKDFKYLYRRIRRLRRLRQ